MDDDTHDPPNASDRGRDSSWTFPSRPRQIAIGLGVVLFVGYFVYGGMQGLYLLMRDGLPETWTLPNTAAVLYTVGSLLLVVGGGIGILVLSWRKLASQREMRDIAEGDEENERSGENGVVFEFDADGEESRDAAVERAERSRADVSDTQS